jgi:hypothetical protein
MPTLTPSLAFIIGFIVAPVLFALSAYFTRAPARGIIGALAGAVAYSTLNIIWDRLAAAAGWWVYPFASTWVDTLPLYIPAGLVAGGAFGLVGWRVSRRWPKGRGLVAFLLVWGVWGVIHDFGGLAITGATNLMTFGPGLAPVIADFLTYVTCGALAQLAMRLVAGPASADPLARTSRPARAA